MAHAFDSNPHFQSFLTQLAARGVEWRWAWRCRRDGRLPSKDLPADTGMLLFKGRGFQPKQLNAIVLDYGDRDGFGLYLDSPHTAIEADADEIAGPEADFPDARMATAGA